MFPTVPRQVCVTGAGLVTALGDDVATVARGVAGGARGLRAHAPLEALPGGPLAGVVDGPDLRPWLVRKKDRKLLARSSELALAAAGRALGDWPGDRAELGIFVGVGREPPDDGESEASLAAACREGALDEGLLAGPGRDLYPPLLPLRTLPNLVLAHVSINLGIGGENAAWAGSAAAGLRAVAAAAWAVAEGRCDAALAGGADSLVDLGNARDRLRTGRTGPPGEAAAFVLLEALPVAWGRGARILALIEPVDPGSPGPGPTARGPTHQAALGDCGAADGALLLLLEVLAAAQSGRSRAVALGGPGTAPVAMRVRAPTPC